MYNVRRIYLKYQVTKYQVTNLPPLCCIRLFEQRCHIDGENSCLLLLLIIFCGDKETFAYSGWILIPFQAATLPNRLIYADI